MYAKNKISISQKTSYGVMLLAVFLLAFSGAGGSFVHAQAWSSTHEITYFQGNKAGAVSFTFDDGTESQATNGASELNARGLRGTFFVIPTRGEVSWETWQSLADQGHEIASHTTTHRDLTSLTISEIIWELSESQSIINQNVLGQSCMTISYPLTHTNSTIQDIAPSYYVAARAGWLADNPNYYEPGGDEFGSWNMIDFANIGSTLGDNLPLDNWTFNRALDNAVQHHGWFDLHFHEIDDVSAFGNILDYILGRDAYWIDTFSNIARYMKERLNSTILILTDTSSEIRISIVMNASLPTSLYNVPLTIRSTVPVSWSQVAVQQGSSIQIITPVIEGSDKVIYYDALPNGGDIVLAVSNPVPGLANLSPGSTFAGGSSFILTVTGTNFVNNSIVRWNGVDRVTTYVSNTQLTAMISASNIASIGNPNVRVFNPAPGGGASNPLPFSIVARPVTVTVNASQSKTYGSPDPILTYTSSDLGVIFAGALSRGPGENAGTYAINQGTLTAISSNYNITSFVPANFTINRKTASVTPNAVGKTVGSVDPVLTGTLVGFLPADNVTATYARTAGETIAGNPYTISASLSPAGILGNYNITYNTANFLISRLVQTPILRSPQSNLLTTNKLPTFSWGSVTEGQTYEIVFSTNSAFTNIVESEIVGALSYPAPSPFGDGQYYWRVRAYNASNQSGKWSSFRSFTIDTIGPSVPVLSSPANNASTRKPTFKWVSVSTAVSYQFQYDNDSNFSSPKYTVTTRSNFRKPPAMKVGVYYWRVRAQDSVGNWGAWSTPYKVTITGP